VAWRLLIFEVADTNIDVATDLLETMGAVAVTATASGDEVVLEPDPGATPFWRRARMQGLFTWDADVERLRALVEAELEGLGVEIGPIESGMLEDDDWSNTWRRFSGPMRFGDRLVVVPRDWSEPSEEIVLRLDPGLAFGTGSHPTTAMCLEWLSRADLKGKSIVDFGCGSGILSIAALLLGAARVVAIDHDPQARVATAENASYNGIGLAAGRLQIRSVETGEFAANDIVVANILANPLIELAPVLSRLVKVGGSLLLSGIRREQLSRVQAAYGNVAFGEPALMDEWVAIEGTRLRA
jgi:ribosomal protein L11 methyltransferase